MNEDFVELFGVEIDSNDTPFLNSMKEAHDNIEKSLSQLLHKK